jgi:hypothetical protein
MNREHSNLYENLHNGDSSIYGRKEFIIDWLGHKREVFTRQIHIYNMFVFQYLQVYHTVRSHIYDGKAFKPNKPEELTDEMIGLVLEERELLKSLNVFAPIVEPNAIDLNDIF